MSARTTLSDELRVARLIADRFEASGITSEDPDYAILLDTECDAPERIRRILRAARFQDAQIAALNAMIVEMEARSTRFANRVASLRSVASGAMSELGLTKLEAPDLTASLRAGKPSLVGDIDPEKLPDRLCRITRTANRAAVRAALEAGETVEGATLGNAAPVLTVRVQ